MMAVLASSCKAPAGSDSTDSDSAVGEDAGVDGSTEVEVDTDTIVEEQVAELLSRLTLEQKAAQMTQALYSEVNAIDVRNYCFGSVFVGGGGEPIGRDSDPERAAAAMDALQQAAIEGCGVPLLIGSDAVHGNADLPGSRGIGVADVLYGNVGFSGVLPHTWPASYDHIPINVDKQPDENGLDAS
jgi:beta-glucosidase